MRIPLGDILEKLTGIGPGASEKEVTAAIERLDAFVEAEGDIPVHVENLSTGEKKDSVEHSPRMRELGDRFLGGLKKVNEAGRSGKNRAPSTEAEDPTSTE